MDHAMRAISNRQHLLRERYLTPRMERSPYMIRSLSTREPNQPSSLHRPSYQQMPLSLSGLAQTVIPSSCRERMLWRSSAATASMVELALFLGSSPTAMPPPSSRQSMERSLPGILAPYRQRWAWAWMDFLALRYAILALSIRTRAIMSPRNIW